ncbi:hypothetical protein BKA69DRAFT_1079381 [Paraphysoderma sedebokerense]|nr:hypothetical protein BKA69DRAFT_1079381 [Paraphysoderma sedebokerense]
MKVRSSIIFILIHIFNILPQSLHLPIPDPAIPISVVAPHLIGGITSGITGAFIGATLAQRDKSEDRKLQEQQAAKVAKQKQILSKDEQMVLSQAKKELEAAQNVRKKLEVELKQATVARQRAEETSAQLAESQATFMRHTEDTRDRDLKRHQRPTIGEDNLSVDSDINETNDIVDLTKRPPSDRIERVTRDDMEFA